MVTKISALLNTSDPRGGWLGGLPPRTPWMVGEQELIVIKEKGLTLQTDLFDV